MPNKKCHRYLSINKPWAAFKYLGLAAFLLVVFAPLAVLAVQFLLKLPDGPGKWLELAVPTGRRLSLFIRSVGLASGVSIWTGILGVVAASVLMYWNRGRAGRLRWLFMVTALLPPYVHSIAWDSLFARLAQWGLPFAFEGWLAAWWVQSMAFLPLAIALALISLESADRQLVQMALTMQNQLKVFSRVVIPLAWPALLAGAGLIFVLSITDYAIPALYDLQVYPLEIFADFSATNQPERALALALPLLAGTVLLLACAQALIRNAAAASSPDAAHISPALFWKGPFGALQMAALALLSLNVIVPLGELLQKTASWQTFVLSISLAREELAYTFLVAVLAAALVLPLALAPAASLANNSGRSRTWWLLTTAPLALPASLVGIGLVTVWNSPLLSGIYGSLMMPVLAGLARFAPIAVIIVSAQWRRIDRDMLEAGMLMQSSPLQGLLKIQLPLLKPGLAAAALAVFILTLGELGATLLVAPPGQATLTMRVFNLMHYGAGDSVAGLCLMLVLIGLAAGTVSVMLMLRPASTYEKGG